jgi:hypothetical protein
MVPERVGNLNCPRFTSGQDKSLLGQIQNFIAAESSLQQVSNPSGTISTGGLGEPKVIQSGIANYPR